MTRVAVCALAAAIASAGCDVANLGRAQADADRPLGPDAAPPPSVVEIVSGAKPRWIKRSLPFLETEGAELVFLADGAGVLVVQQGAAATIDLGRTWDVLPPAGVDTRYSNDGGKSFVDEATTHEQWFVKGPYDRTFSVATSCVAGDRLYLFGIGANSSRISSIALPPRTGPTRHRVFWYDGPKFGCMAAAGERVYAGGDVRDQPVLYRAEDDGKTWTPTWWGRTGEPIPRALSFLDADRGVMLMSDGTLERTTDACRTWQTAGSLPVDKAPLVNSMTFVDETVGFAVGRGGLLLATRDGARTWIVCKPPTGRDLNRVVAASREVVWVVGDAGTILSSATGGQTWEKADLGVGENLRCLTLYKGATWIVGDGSIYILPPADGSPLVPEPARPEAPVHPFGRPTCAETPPPSNAPSSQEPSVPAPPASEADPLAPADPFARPPVVHVGSDRRSHKTRAPREAANRPGEP